MRFVHCAFAAVLGISTLAAQAATLTDDLLPDYGTQGLIDPQGPSGGLSITDPTVLERFDAARQNFEAAVDILEEELRTQANYAGILALAPQLRGYARENARLAWLHALALAANGQIDAAEAEMARGATLPQGADSPLRMLAEAMLAFRTGDPDAAAGQVRAALGQAPDYAYAHNLLGIIEAQRGNAETAAAAFAEAARLSPRSLIFLRNLGIAEFGLERIGPAAEALNRALEVDPADCTSLIAQAKLYEAAQRPVEAAGFVARCLNVESGDARAVGYLVALQVRQRDIDGALATVTRYQQVLAQPNVLRAELYMILNQPGDAVQALDFADATPEAALRKALARAMTGDLEEALRRLREMPGEARGDIRAALAELALSVAVEGTVPPAVAGILGARPDTAPWLAWFTALAAAGDSPAAAAEAAQGAQDMLPGVRFAGVPAQDWQTLADPEIRAQAALGMLWLYVEFDRAAQAAFTAGHARGSAEQLRYFGAIADVRLGEGARALRRLEPVAASAPDYYSAQVLLGELQLNYGMLHEALESYRRAAAQVEDPGALIKIGLLADELNEVPVAEDALRRYIALQPKSFVGYNQLAWVFIQREIRLDEALTLAETANRIQPGNASIMDNLGWIRFLRGDAQGARAMLLEANRRSGAQNPFILYHLAVVEADLGAAARSRELLDRLTEIAPPGHETLDRAEDLRTRLQ